MNRQPYRLIVNIVLLLAAEAIIGTCGYLFVLAMVGELP